MVVLILLIVLFLSSFRDAALGRVVEAKVMQQQDWQTPVDRTNSRLLQDDNTVTYTARYEAQFQQARGALCLTVPPIIRVVCNGPATIQVLNTSDPSIVCSSTAQINEYGGTYLECENTCTDDNCRDIYESVGLGYTSGPFGSIEFQCEATNVFGVEASVFVEALENDNCAGDGSVYYYVRLGVFCANGYGTNYAAGSYVYDDFIFECLQGSFAQYEEGIYTCIYGDSCPGVSCSFSIGEFSVYADITTYHDQCITPVIPLTLAPTSSPVAPEANRFVSSATFEAAWGNLLESSCASSSPTVLISCLNGEISNVDPASATINCTDLGLGAIECIETDPEKLENKFTLVRYNCTARTVPTSSIVYPEQDAYCSGNARNSTVKHAVQMGVYCERGEFRFSNDRFLECVDRDHDFDYIREPGSSVADGSRFTCTKSAIFPIGATPNQSQLIPSVGMVTADNWYSTTGLDCSGGLLSTNYTKASAPTPTPTKAPYTSAPTPRVTPIPTVTSTQLSTMAPMEPPSPSPALGVPPVTPETAFPPALSSTTTRNTSDSSFIDKFIYMLAGGAVVIVVVAFAIVIQRRRAITPKDEGTPMSGHQPVDTTEHHDDEVFDADGGRPAERVADTLSIAGRFGEFDAGDKVIGDMPAVTTYEQGIRYHDNSKSRVHYKDQVRENVLTTETTFPEATDNSEIFESDSGLLVENPVLQGHLQQPASLAVADSAKQGNHVLQTATDPSVPSNAFTPADPIFPLVQSRHLMSAVREAHATNLHAQPSRAQIQQSRAHSTEGDDDINDTYGNNRTPRDIGQTNTRRSIDP